MCQRFIAHIVGEPIIARAEGIDKRPDATLPRMKLDEMDAEVDLTRRKIFNVTWQVLGDFPVHINNLKYDIVRRMCCMVLHVNMTTAETRRGKSKEVMQM